ncbi:hypothetical protein N7462_006627 [Penicillium macrosclerotiorum]|uniref:uncharacterized protein n=1 Tax=Penicillium macrosclerotiorum TaxID=303699 RepID=UPI0025466DC1|nr:uncharacterized protein N7462_006627 [Penicillium macrosclerotiorum]KAJ5683462.1 hypothetical protein N7462_006627 [Penicillium macrosclerotiorum]
MGNADMLLQDWRASLPGNLVPNQDSADSEDQISSIATSLLNCTYLNAVIMVHRFSLLCRSRLNYMLSHPNRRIVGSEKVCLDAAHDLAHAINNLIAERRLNPIPRWIHPYAINSVMAIFLSLMKSPRKWSRDIYLALLRSMHHCFRNREDTALLSRFQTFLETLIQATETQVLHGHDPGPARNEMYRTQMNSPSDSRTGAWTHNLLSHTADDLAQRMETDGQNRVTPRDEEFQFGDLFSDQYNLWNFQLWPLAPLNDDGLCMNGEFNIQNSGKLEDVSPQ